MTNGQLAYFSTLTLSFPSLHVVLYFVNVFIVSIHRMYSYTYVARFIHRAAAASLPLAGLDPSQVVSPQLSQKSCHSWFDLCLGHYSQPSVDGTL